MTKNILSLCLILGFLAAATSLEVKRSNRVGLQAQPQPLASSSSTSTSTPTATASPQVQSSAPATQSSAPATQSSAPATQSSAPATQSSAPATQDSEPSSPPPTNDQLVAQLLLASSSLQRINILGSDSDFVFDFLNPPANVSIESGNGGSITTATRESFPAAVGNGLAMSIGYISPCGLNTPHIHPRASEMNFAVNGTFSTGFIAENGARTVINTVYPGQMSIFPKGSIHWQANMGCQTVMFVAAYNDEDPGTTQIAQNFFSLPEALLAATLGGVSASTISSIASNIPADVAQGLTSCLQNCGFLNNNYGNYYGNYPNIQGYGNYPSTQGYGNYPSTQGNGKRPQTN